MPVFGQIEVGVNKAHLRLVWSAEAVLLSIEDAVHLAREIAHAARRSVEKSNLELVLLLFRFSCRRRALLPSEESEQTEFMILDGCLCGVTRWKKLNNCRQSRDLVNGEANKSKQEGQGMNGGPFPMTQAVRRAFAQELVERILQVYQNRVQAIGLYGSMARGTDGPSSDMELFCVLASTGENFLTHWITNTMKVGVKLSSEEVLLSRAAQVQWDWPVTHARFIHAQALHDSYHVLPTLSLIAKSQPAAKFLAAMRELLIGRVYEFIGKLRKASALGENTSVPIVAVDLALCGAYLLGLAHQHCYAMATQMLSESLLLSDQPGGYEPLCRLVMEGDLRDTSRVLDACEAFWSGLEPWSASRGIRLEESRRIPF